MIAVCVIVLLAAGGLYLGWVNGPVVLGCVVLSAAAAYLLGCSNGAVLVSKYVLRDDVRTHGSGNAGLTNFYRSFGGPLTLLVIFSDVLKMVLAVYLSVWMWHVIGAGAPVAAKYWAGVWCLVGHMFPCMFHFKGGKGILSGGTLALLLDWRIALVVWGGFLLLTALTKYVSLGSLWAGASFPFISWYVYRDTRVLLPLAAACGILVVWGHRANVVRLLEGTENKFSLHKKRE